MPRLYIEINISPRVKPAISQGSGTMDPHTVADVFIMLVIFFALIVSLCVLAWRYPTLCRMILMHDAALPTTNITLPMHFITTRRRSFSYLLRLPGMSFVICWWACRASHNRTNRIPSITISHHEYTVAHALPSNGAVRLSTRALTPTSTIAPTSSGGASTIDTLVGSEAIKFHELDGTKGRNTSSFAETNDMNSGEPIVHVRVGLVSEAIEPSHPTVCPTLEVDLADIDIVTIGDRSCE